MIEIWHEEMNKPFASKRAYDAIYRDEGILQRDSFYLWLLRLLDPLPGKVLVDISCGQGRLVNLASQRGIPAIGVDFSNKALSRAVQGRQDPHFCVSDGEQLPFADQSIDYITHIGSIEHYAHPEIGAREIGRVLKPTGRACILLPNVFGLWGNIRYNLTHGEVFDDGQPIQRYATRRTWQHILEQSGLEIKHTWPYNEVAWPRTWADARWLITKPQKIARALLSTLIPTNLSNHFVFLCSRRDNHSMLKPHWEYRV